jgi:hypothetical protein
MTQLQFFATVGAVTLLFVAGGALGSVFTLWLSDRPERPRKPAPKPRAENRNKQVAVSAHPVQAVVVYQDPIRLPALDADITEVRERTPDLTRYDLLQEHVERGIRARGGRAS